jgi:hypothetical protein
MALILENPRAFILSARIDYFPEMDNGKYSRPYQLQWKNRHHKIESYIFKTLVGAKIHFSTNVLAKKYHGQNQWIKET